MPNGTPTHFKCTFPDQREGRKLYTVEKFKKGPRKPKVPGHRDCEEDTEQFYQSFRIAKAEIDLHT